MQDIADKRILLRKKIAVAEIELVLVVANEEPEGVVDDAVQMLFFYARAAKRGKGAPDWQGVGEGVSIRHEADGEVSEPGEAVALDAVEQEFAVAKMQCVSGLVPDVVELFVGVKHAAQRGSVRDGLAVDDYRGVGFDARIAEGERQRRAPAPWRRLT